MPTITTFLLFLLKYPGRRACVFRRLLVLLFWQTIAAPLVPLNRERRRLLLILPERRISQIRSCWCITLVTARITYETDGVMKLQLDLEIVPVTHWRIVCNALRRISESVVSWVTYIGELHAFLWSYIIPSLYVTNSSSNIVLSPLVPLN